MRNDTLDKILANRFGFNGWLPCPVEPQIPENSTEISEWLPKQKFDASEWYTPLSVTNKSFHAKDTPLDGYILNKAIRQTCKNIHNYSKSKRTYTCPYYVGSTYHMDLELLRREYNSLMLESHRKYPYDKLPEIYRKVYKEEKCWGRPTDLDWTIKNVTNQISRDSQDDAVLKETFTVITSVNRPKKERRAGNKKESTFDFIRIRFGLVTKENMKARGWDRMEFLKLHKPQLIQIALDKISSDRYYQKSGVPVSFLRLSNMTVTSQDELEFLFELKEV